MTKSSCVAALRVAAPLFFTCLFAVGCGEKKAPATAPVPPRPAAAAPAPAAVVPAPTAPAPASAPGNHARSSAPGAGVYTPAPAPLVGHVTRDELENYDTWKTLRAEDYSPDAAAVQTIADKWRGIRVLVILGTWCKDSKRDLPRFFKIADLAKLRLDGVTFVAVDRTKKDAEGLTQTHKVERVPTFVFFRGDTEVGRVIERPTTTLEADIAAILTK